MPKSPALKSVVLALQQRVEELEKRPDILTLNPDETYVLVVPEDTAPSDYDALTSAVSRYPNVVVLAANDLKFIRIT